MILLAMTIVAARLAPVMYRRRRDAAGRRRYCSTPHRIRHGHAAGGQKFDTA